MIGVVGQGIHDATAGADGEPLRSPSQPLGRAGTDQRPDQGPGPAGQRLLVAVAVVVKESGSG